MARFRSIFAWWYLTKAEKAALRAERMKGRFGGHAVIARYWWLQETGTYPSPYGGKPKRFVEKAIADLRARLPSIKAETLGA